MRKVILTPEEIGIKIKLARKSKGIAQTEFADAIGKSVRTVQKYESGEISMPLEVLNSIANELELSLEDLLTEEQPGTNIDTFADIFSAIFELENAQGIKLEIEEVPVSDSRIVLAMYCDAMEYDFMRFCMINEYIYQNCPKRNAPMGTYREDYEPALSREQVSEQMNCVARDLEHRVQLQQLMSHMTAKEKEVVCMRAAGYTYREIAEHCNITMRGVSARLIRMRKRFRALALI